jgi:hypothetical protein
MDHIAGTDTHEFHDDADIMDQVAALDADTFELLDQTAVEPTNHSDAVIPEQEPPVDLSASPPAPEGQEQSIAGAEMEPRLLTIDRFPLGRPGTVLIDDLSQDPCQASGSQGVSLGTIWAPFHSHCDWAIARWAKMRGPSSSAVTELLSIPGVCERYSSFILLLIFLKRLWKGLGYHIKRRTNSIISLTTICPGARNLKVNKLSSGMKHLTFITAMFFSASGPSMGTLHSHMT